MTCCGAGDALARAADRVEADCQCSHQAVLAVASTRLELETSASAQVVIVVTAEPPILRGEVASGRLPRSRAPPHDPPGPATWLVYRRLLI
jgi:hypothetical protein